MTNNERKEVLRAIFTDITLWNIVCGLRGPDNGDEDLKSETTAKLRGRIARELNLTTKILVCVGLTFLNPMNCEVNLQNDTIDYTKAKNLHFSAHLQNAEREVETLFAKELTDEPQLS